MSSTDTRSTNAPGLHHIAVRVRDYDASLRFYTQSLGFRVAYAWPSGERRIALLDAGDGNYIEIISTPSGDNAEAAPNGALIHFALRVPDAAAAYQQALQGGATPHIEPKSVTLEGGGERSNQPVVVHLAFCKGPEGEIIEFFQNDIL